MTIVSVLNSQRFKTLQNVLRFVILGREITKRFSQTCRGRAVPYRALPRAKQESVPAKTPNPSYFALVLTLVEEQPIKNEADTEAFKAYVLARKDAW
jgi:hypothetical protein